MDEPRMGYGRVQIIVALISMAGALGVAWITTQARFDSELESRAPELAQMKAKLDLAEQRLKAVDERLHRLDAQIDLAQSAASGLVKAGSKLLSGARK
jgi:chromosome segregation ATPase